MRSAGRIGHLGCGAGTSDVRLSAKGRFQESKEAAFCWL